MTGSWDNLEVCKFFRHVRGSRLGYYSRCHLSICSAYGHGSSPSDKFVEERGPVHIVVTDTIVAISVQRASVATIVSVAEQFDTAKAALGESTNLLYFVNACKGNVYFLNIQVKQK